MFMDFQGEFLMLQMLEVVVTNLNAILRLEGVDVELQGVEQQCQAVRRYQETVAMALQMILLDLQ